MKACEAKMNDYPFSKYQAIWIVAYVDTEKNNLMPCYDCGLHRFKEEAEAHAFNNHDSDGIPTCAVQLGHFNKP